jgi:hypothetical protein
MKQRLKQYLIWAILLALGYFILSHHFIYSNRSFRLLKKSELTLTYTFFSLDNKRPEKILAIDELRWDGVGDILVEKGMLSERQREMLENRYDSEE